MTVEQILHHTEHRPWTKPAEPWRYYQEWNNAVFLHWEVPYEEVKKHVPADLEIDLYQGKSWVSMVAFTMEKIRPRFLPSFAPISNFNEINIRTYVKKNGRNGVYFLSIEAGNKISCLVAKSLSELPYTYSRIKRKGTLYSSNNIRLNNCLKIEYEVGQELIEKTPLDKWLVERYALYQDTPTSINQFEIHHIAWQTFKLEIKHIEIEYTKFKKLMNHWPDKTHYSTGVQVIAWGKQRVNKNTQ